MTQFNPPIRNALRENPRNLRFILISLFLVPHFNLTASSCRADSGDWPQWRGSHRDGVAGDFHLPRNWLDAELKVRWQVPLGEGYATPLVTRDRVFTFGRELGSEVVQAHELATGRVRWRVAYPARYEAKEMAGVHAAGPRATPVLHGGRLFTFGINEILNCLDASTGQVLWRCDTPRRYATEPPGYGASSSPMIVGRLLIVPAAERVIAMDWKSGSTVWRATADAFYSSLIATDSAGRNQIVGFARYRLVGLRPLDGRVLWSRKYASTWGSNVVTPVVWKDRVVVSSPTQGTRSFRLFERDGRLAIEPVWQTKAMRAYLTSPVVHADHVFGLDESGQLLCLDLATGRTAWATGNFGEYGTLVLVGDQLLILSGDGELTSIEATPAGYRELGRRDVARTPTWTHLVVAHGCMFVRDKKELRCFELPGSPGESK